MNLTAGVTVVKDVVLTGTALADVIHAKLLVFHISQLEHDKFKNPLKM